MFSKFITRSEVQSIVDKKEAATLASIMRHIQSVRDSLKNCVSQQNKVSQLEKKIALLEKHLKIEIVEGVTEYKKVSKKK
jgi:hypothetical protein